MIEIIPGLVRRLPGFMRPVVPDPGVPFQLVHQDDVASALLAAIHGDGPPGAYNLAGPGTLRARDLASALGWLSVPVPRASVDLTALTARLPLAPAKAQWLSAFRVPVVMDTTKARSQLGWEPQHDAASVLEETVAAARERDLV
jgi:UDP-glucose 4-epimerase